MDTVPIKVTTMRHTADWMILRSRDDDEDEKDRDDFGRRIFVMMMYVDR